MRIRAVEEEMLECERDVELGSVGEGEGKSGWRLWIADVGFWQGPSTPESRTGWVAPG
jgi:hypothetical protein